MNVLSLFDGISCGRLALERAGVRVDNYFTSEIDPYAIQISKKNWPDNIQLGDVERWKTWDLPKIDLIIAGSPCQGFSRAGIGLNFEDPRSKLFFTFCDILAAYHPEYYLLENVMMKSEWQEIITDRMKVNPVVIDSALVSAQHRKRLYWTNIPFLQPEDKHIYLKDVINDDYPVILHNIYGGFSENTVRVFIDKSPTIRTSAGGGHIPSVVRENLVRSAEVVRYVKDHVKNPDDFLLQANINNRKSAQRVAELFKTLSYNIFKTWNCARTLYPLECERLQTLPDNYTQGVSNTQRYKMIGNGWTVDMIAYIFKSLVMKGVE